MFPTEGQHADLLFFYCYCLKRKKNIENDSGFKQRGMKQKKTVLERRQLFFFLRDQRWYTMMPLSEVFCIVAHSDGALCFFFVLLLFFFALVSQPFFIRKCSFFFRHTSESVIKRSKRNGRQALAFNSDWQAV